MHTQEIGPDAIHSLPHTDTHNNNTDNTASLSKWGTTHTQCYVKHGTMFRHTQHTHTHTHAHAHTHTHTQHIGSGMTRNDQVLHTAQRSHTHTHAHTHTHTHTTRTHTHTHTHTHSTLSGTRRNTLGSQPLHNVHKHTHMQYWPHTLPHTHTRTHTHTHWLLLASGTRRKQSVVLPYTTFTKKTHTHAHNNNNNIIVNIA
jgi:hypothetical protein